MLLRVSVQLPNQAACSLEFYDRDLAREMMRLCIEVSHTMVPGYVPTNGGAAEPEDTSPRVELPTPTVVAAVTSSTPDKSMFPAEGAEHPASEQAVEYCRQISPIGDMRRVVVATQAAEYYMQLPGVSALELGGIFDQAGWPRPRDFVQAIRNAARKGFRWLERVPGEAGYYRVTPQGRTAVLGDNHGLDAPN